MYHDEPIEIQFYACGRQKTEDGSNTNVWLKIMDILKLSLCIKQYGRNTFSRFSINSETNYSENLSSLLIVERNVDSVHNNYPYRKVKYIYRPSQIYNTFETFIYYFKESIYFYYLSEIIFLENINMIIYSFSA